MKVQLIFKTLLIVAVAIVTFSASSLAQNTKQIENVKIGFITNELDLDEKQAQQFWPVYNKYEGQLKSLYKKIQKNDLGAEEAMNIETDVLNVKKKRINALKDILSKDQLNKLVNAEKKFTRMILNKLKE